MAATRLSWALYLGYAAAVLAWLVILVSVYLNPWFSFTANPFSDLGGPKASHPWVYNYGMMVVAALMALYSAALLDSAANKLESAGASFMFVAAVFLALIGYFHEGTYPHVFVSKWFFAQADMAVLAWGLGSLVEGRRTSIGELAIAVAGPAAAALVRWPPGAVLEAYGVVLIDAAVVLLTLDALSHSGT